MEIEIPVFTTLAPEIFLLASAALILVVDLFLKDKQKVVSYWMSVAALLLTMVLTVLTQITVDGAILSGTYKVDVFGVVLKSTVLFIVAGVFIYSRTYLEVRELLRGEFFILAIMGTLGMMILIAAHSLVTIYLGIELLSLSMYAMVVYCRENHASIESGIKYFIMGAVASGILLFGMSLIYGVAGSLDIFEIRESLLSAETIPLSVMFGLVLMIIGVAFKFGAVPFHMWVPDVYHGSATVVGLYVGTAPKVAAFALAMRLLVEGFGAIHTQWADIFIVLAILSCLVGNVVAITQSNIKRMLGYSAVAHIGFILLGFVTGETSVTNGYLSSMFYVIVYSIMAAGAFGIVIFLSDRGFESGEIDDFKGLSKRNQWVAFIMLLIMLSMAGMPGTAGFYAKFLIIQSLVDANMIWLAILFVVFAVIGAFYYLRIIKCMYFDNAYKEALPDSKFEFRILLGVNGIVILGFGIFPDGVISLCRMALF